MVLSNGESSTCPTKSQQSVGESTREAAEVYLPGMAQLESAERVVFLEDTRALAKADREKVLRLEAKRLWGKTDVSDVKEPEMGDMIVTGDIHVGSEDRVKVMEKLLGQVQEQSSSESQQDAPIPASKIPGWVKLVGASLVSAGIGATGALGYGLMKKEEPSVVITPPPVAESAPINTDKWNEYDIEKWIPN